MARLARLLNVIAVAATVAVTFLAVPAPLRADPIGQIAALSPAVSFGQPARLPTADEQAARGKPDETDQYGFDPSVHRILYGTALLGGAFTLGFVATGSLSTGIAAAGAVMLSYAVLP